MPTLYWLSRPVRELPIHQALLTNFAMPILSRIGNQMESKVCFLLAPVTLSCIKICSKSEYLHHFVKTEMLSSSVHYKFLAFQQQKRSTA